MVELLKKRKKPVKKTKAKPSVSQVVKQIVHIHTTKAPAKKRAKRSTAVSNRVGSTGGTHSTQALPKGQSPNEHLLALLLNNFQSKQMSTDHTQIAAAAPPPPAPAAPPTIGPPAPPPRALPAPTLPERGRSTKKTRTSKRSSSEPPVTLAFVRDKTVFAGETSADSSGGSQYSKFQDKKPSVDKAVLDPTKSVPVRTPSEPAPFGIDNSGKPVMGDGSGGGGSNRFTQTLRDLKEVSPASERSPKSPIPKPVVKPPAKPPSSKLDAMKSAEAERGKADFEMRSAELKRGKASDEFVDAESGDDESKISPTKPKVKPPVVDSKPPTTKVEAMKSPEVKRGEAAAEMTSTELTRGANFGESLSAIEDPGDAKVDASSLRKELEDQEDQQVRMDALEKLGEYDMKDEASVTNARERYKKLSKPFRDAIDDVGEDLLEAREKFSSDRKKANLAAAESKKKKAAAEETGDDKSILTIVGSYDLDKKLSFKDNKAQRASFQTSYDKFNKLTAAQKLKIPDFAKQLKSDEDHIRAQVIANRKK